MEKRTDQRVFWHGKLKEKSRKTWQATALTALCSVALFCLLFSYKKMYPFGDGSVAITDLYSQYLPLLYHFYDVVTGQKNLFLDFSVSGGANLYADTINELINPFNYVLLLFGRDRLYQAVNVLVLLYSVGSAVTAHIFLEKTAPGRSFQNVPLAVCYACCGYMAYNYQIIKWMIFPVVFPLFCLALLRLLKEKKGGWYAVLLSWQLMLSIQLGFMTLLFSLFAGAIWLYTCEERENRIRKMGCMGIYTLIGLCISAAVLLPSAILLLQSARSGENLSYFGVMKRHGLDDLFERLFQIANPVLIGILLASGRVWKREKRGGTERENRSCEERFWLYLTGFLWLTVLLEPANLLWHMGSYVCFPVRYGYMAVLSMAAFVAVGDGHDAAFVAAKNGSSGNCGWADVECAKHDVQTGGQNADVPNTENACMQRTRLRWRGALLLIASAVSVLGAVCLTLVWEDRLVQAFSSLAISKVCPKETAVTALVLLLFVVSAWCGQKALREKEFLKKAVPVMSSAPAILCGLVCGFCVYTMILLPPDYAVRQENEAAYRQMTEIAQQREKKIAAQMEETGSAAPAELSWLLAREQDRNDLPINAALVDRKGSISGYFPTESKQTKAVLEGLGYLAPWVSVRAVGGTEISDTMLRSAYVFPQGAGQQVSDPDAVGEKVDASQQAQSAGDLKTVVAGHSDELSPDSSRSVLSNQQAWAELLLGEDVETENQQTFKEDQDTDALTGSKSHASIFEVFPVQELVQEDGTLCISVTDRQLLYLDAGRSADEIFVSVNGEQVEIPEKNQTASAHRLILLGTFEAQDVVVSVTDLMGVPVAEQEMELGALHEEKWQAALQRVRVDAGAETEQKPAVWQTADEMEQTKAEAELESGASQTADKTHQSGIARILHPSELSISECSAKIQVNVSAAEGETLFVPFVAIDGWKCIQNGKTVDITPVLGGFLGITLTEGENEVVFFFEEPGLKAGLLISALGVALLLLVLLTGWKAGIGRWKIAAEQKAVSDKQISDMQEQTTEISGNAKSDKIGLQQVEKCFGRVYQLLLAAFFAGIYVIPTIGMIVYLAGKVVMKFFG